jgi:hypothetical protein
MISIASLRPGAYGASTPTKPVHEDAMISYHHIERLHDVLLRVLREAPRPVLLEPITER